MLKKVILVLSASLLAVSMMSGCSKKDGADEVSEKIESMGYGGAGVELQFADPTKGDTVAVMKTNKGDITIKLFPDQAPKAVENFVTHAKDGYYDGLTFHRVIKDFMIQGGDPKGDGTGGESIWTDPFEDEFTPLLHNYRGALSMANSGANTNGSQFFIVQATDVAQDFVDMVNQYKESSGETVVDQTADGKDITFNDVYSDEVVAKYQEVGGTMHLDYAHTVFGQVVEGLDIVDAIANVEVGAEDKPVEDVIIESIEIQEK